jgi:tRNA-splicing ligase RtcB
MRVDRCLRRVDEQVLTVENPYGVPVTLVAREDVPIEQEGIVQLFGFLSLQETVEQLASWERSGRIASFFGGEDPSLVQVVVTPDFHRGGGIPVGTVAQARGFVIPAAIGNDICCGMRLLVTDVTRDEIVPHLDAIQQRLRGIFFGGQRDIPLSPRQREALLREGLVGLHETRQDNADTGLWQYYDARSQGADLARVHARGSLATRGVFAFDDFIRGAGAPDGRDGQIGSVGGGNHFVEIQTVEEIVDGWAAHEWDVCRGRVTVMVHSGSVGLGHMVGGHFGERARAIYPGNVRHPEHGFYVLPTEGPHAAEADRYLDAMGNAANFAFGNRLFLGLMAVRAMGEAMGRRVGASLVYDVPHNLIWRAPGQQGHFLHRKGACPALGPEPDREGSPFRYTGHPVVIPGSMGAASFLLAGEGKQELLASACHGAGRSLSRGESLHVDEATYRDAVGALRIVNPIDPRSPQMQRRPDLLKKYHDRLREEAPFAYKPITPVIETVEKAGVAHQVARVLPLITVKG